MRSRTHPSASNASPSMCDASAAGQASTRVALFTRVRLYREGLTRLLAGRVACAAFDANREPDEWLGRVVAFAPDVALLDVATLRSGDQLAPLRAALPALRIVAFGLAEEEEDVLACAHTGVAAFVSRDASVEDLLSAIAGARRGELHCSPRLAALMFGHLAALARETVTPTGSTLTMRQREILALVEQGLTNKEIAARLSIEISTVKNHVHHLLERLQVRHRWEVGMAIRRVRLASASASETPRREIARS